jgi:hypothetical protein
MEVTDESNATAPQLGTTHYNITRDLLDSVKSWNELMVVVDSTGALLEKAGG